MPAKKIKKKSKRRNKDKRISKILEKRRKNMLIFALMYKVPGRSYCALKYRAGKN